MNETKKTTAGARALASTLAATACLVLAACGGSGGSSAAAPTTPPTTPPTVEPPPAVDGPMVRQTTAGKIEGVDDSARTGTWSWKGIPFAKPPVSALRWRAPVEPEAWSGIRPAAKFGNACLQLGRLFGPGENNTYDATIGTTLGQPVGSEDCLYVNVWRPATTDKKLPVLLFVHGGSNISGYTADPLYDGAALAKAANAVVITTNYRLGILGFLNVPQLRPGGTAGDDSGNFALLDILAALRYIQANAASFGGDAGNVTLSGESAGATNLLALMTSPMAKGLFHKVFEMSGGISLASNLPAGKLPTLTPASTKQGETLLEKLLVTDGTAVDAANARTYLATRTPAQVADYLRAQDGKALLRVVQAAGLNSANPIPDGTVIPVDPIGAIAAGNYIQVPALTGNTRDEGKLFAGLLGSLGIPDFKAGWIVDDAKRFEMMFGYNPDAVPTLTVEDIIDPFYLPVGKAGTGYNAATALITRGLFEANRDNLLGAMKQHQSNIWHYRFDWDQAPAPWNEVYGAAHAFDLAFVFGNFGPALLTNAEFSQANKPGRIALSNAVMASVGAFMRNGDPNTSALGATWAPWPAQLLLDATPSVAKITSQSAAPP